MSRKKTSLNARTMFLSGVAAAALFAVTVGIGISIVTGGNEPISTPSESEKNSEDNRSVNEIDVIAMYGALPVFISCKNGAFDSEELYKFNTVAELFGSEFVRKILVTADMENSCHDADSLRERMDEMGIKRIESAHEKREASLARVLRGLCGI